MALPLEPQLRACLKVIYMASLDARIAGWHKNVNPDRLADLMDAIHNIPALILGWENCDEELLKSCLLDYQTKWREDGPSLRSIYEQEILKQTD